MRKINKKSFSVLMVVFVMATGIVFQSCQTENIEEDFVYTYTSRKININELVSIKSSKSKLSNKNNSNFYIQSFFETDFKIPKNLTSEDLRSFVERNLNAINGSISYKFNDDIAIKLNIVNGKIIKEKTQNQLTLAELQKSMSSNSESDDSDCSFGGIRDCANDTIHSLGTVSAIVCAFEFYPCYATAAADCIESNCF